MSKAMTQLSSLSWVPNRAGNRKILITYLTALILVPAPALAAPAADFLGPAPWIVFVFALIGLAGAFFAFFRGRRDRAFGQAIFSAVPSPRQAVAEDGRVLFANPAFKKAFGETDRAMPDLIMDEVDETEDEVRDMIERIWTNAKNGQAGQIEVRVRPRQSDEAGSGAVPDSGLHEWRLLAAYPVDGYPGVVYWSVDDITSRRQVEQVIREEQDRFVDLLEHAPIGFYSVDEEGCFLFVNRTLIEWLAVEHENLEAGSVHLHDVVAETLPKGTPPYSPFPAGNIRSGEVLLRTADGRTFNASVSQEVVRGDDGVSLRTRSVVRDLTRERAMAEALERSEQRFERFFEEAPVGIALIDAKGAVTECNPAFCDLLQSNVEALKLKPLVALLHEESRQALLQATERLGGGQEQPEGRSEGPIEVLFGPEKDTNCSLYMTRMSGASGQLLGFIAHFIDSTEQKKLEVQFAQSQKMQAVGQLAGGIAHDFNNLLTAMIGFSDLLLLRHRPGDQSFADIMQVKQNANRAANLVRQLLAFSRQQTLQPRRLNLTDILAELAHLLRRLMGENLELEMVHGRDLGMVRADQGQLEQVIINLAVNARDAMEGGGTLTIRTANEEVKRQRKSGDESMPPGDYILVEVKDTGCGMPQDVLDRIFEPFFSTKQVGEGTGLGLSTVHGIVKQSGGYVFVESGRGQGTCFSIYLPHDKADKAEVAETTVETQSQRDLTGKGTLLLVEDEDAVRSFGARALRNKGYEVLEANSGESAIEVLNGQGTGVDLIITDVVMPRLDGPSLVRIVRQNTPDIKVIFISGYTEDSFRKSLDEDAALHFLPKPFSLKQLAAKVKEVLEA